MSDTPRRPVAGAEFWKPGTPPRANLLPPEIIERRKQLRQRRAARFGLLLAAIVVAAGTLGALGYNTLSQQLLAADQANLDALNAQQAQYADVANATSTIQLIEAGQYVGASTEVDLKAYLTLLQATLPAGVSLDAVSIDLATPVQPYSQPSTPLQGARVGTLSFTATSDSLFSIPQWLDQLAGLPGFVDATPGQVSLAGATYSAQVVMHIDGEAFSGRFAPTPAPTDGATPAPTDGTEG